METTCAQHYYHYLLLVPTTTTRHHTCYLLYLVLLPTTTKKYCGLVCSRNGGVMDSGRFDDVHWTWIHIRSTPSIHSRSSNACCIPETGGMLFANVHAHALALDPDGSGRSTYVHVRNTTSMYSVLRTPYHVQERKCASWIDESAV